MRGSNQSRFAKPIDNQQDEACFGSRKHLTSELAQLVSACLEKQISGRTWPELNSSVSNPELSLKLNRDDR
jgi:hypothetical protein